MPALVILLLLVAPAWALSQLASVLDPWLLVSVPLALSAACYLAQREDKKQAKAGGQRIPEAWLHLGEFLGGWPGSLVGQWRFRHKTSKGSYQTVVWLIVILHQLLAIDSLRSWYLTRQVLAWSADQLS